MLIVGENINGTIPKIREALIGRDFDFLVDVAIKEEEAGADLIDINVASGEGSAEDEVRDIGHLIGLLKEKVKIDFVIDSPDPLVLKAGIDAAGDRAAMVNSTKATEKSLSEVLPLAAEINKPLVGLLMDESGIPKDVDGRVKAAAKIIDAAKAQGVALKDLYLDPIVMPVSTDITQAKVTLDTIREVRLSWPEVRIILAASNVSFGLPKRAVLNAAMILMASTVGVDAALINPLNKQAMLAVRSSGVLLGQDRRCKKYIKAAKAAEI